MQYPWMASMGEKLIKESQFIVKKRKESQFDVQKRSARPTDELFDLLLEEAFYDDFDNVTPSNYKHLCGASIVSKNYVLTAAHCLEGIELSEIVILMGVSDLENWSPNDGHMFRSVKEKFIHPDYKYRKIQKLIN